MDNNYKCCTSGVDVITRQWALLDGPQDCNCNYLKISNICTVLMWNKAQNLLYIHLILLMMDGSARKM